MNECGQFRTAPKSKVNETQVVSEVNNVGLI